jgi:Protein of Unknown function (DUF2784)
VGYRVLADAVMVIHGASLIFFLVGGFLAWRWLWVVWPHLIITGWNLVIVLLDFGCPVTELEKSLRRRGGEQPYAGGYIQHYVDGRIYPDGYTWLAEIIGFGLFLFSYAVLVWRRLSWRRRSAG